MPIRADVTHAARGRDTRNPHLAIGGQVTHDPLDGPGAPGDAEMPSGGTASRVGGQVLRGSELLVDRPLQPLALDSRDLEIHRSERTVSQPAFLGRARRQCSPGSCSLIAGEIGGEAFSGKHLSDAQS